ncbi:MAG: polysaccharide ABC transporter ATP-binding protein [Bacteroidales bacterium]
MMNEDILIEVDHVSKRFCKDLKRSILYGFSDSMKAIVGKSLDTTTLRKDEFWAVKDVSFQLRRGECLGLIGHNGAGKSTLLKMLNGLIRPDHGQITIRGKIAALIELGAGFNPILTGRENIYNNGAVLGFTKDEITDKIDDIIDFAEIREFIDSPVQNYSSGMKVRLGFAIAAQMEPDVLLIDEVLAVGDIGFTIKCLNRISELIKQCAVIFVSHTMPQVARIASHGLLMNKGLVQMYSSNVPNVIQEYYLHFKNQKTAILGTRSATIHKLDITSASNFSNINGENAISNTDDICIYLSFSVEKKIKKFIINFQFVDKELREVAEISTLNHFEPFENDKEIHNHRLLFQNILSLGSYTVSISITEIIDSNYRFGEVAIRCLSIKEFNIINGNPMTYNAVQIRTKWETNL